MSSTTSPRSRRLVTTGVIGGVLLAVAVPLAASAHVTVTPDSATAGGYSVLTFAFSHGCDGSPTTSLAIDIPDGVESLAPELEPGWTIESIGADEGIPTQVIYTADEPVESGFRATVTVQAKFAEDLAGETVAFPVVQQCAEGETAWAELAEDGQDPHDLDAPAPLVTVTAAEDAHGDTATTEEEASHESDATAEVETTSATVSEADPVARWLGAGGLVAGIAALVVVLVRGRARKS